MEAEHLIMSPGIKELYSLINLSIVLLIAYLGGRRGFQAMMKDRSEGIGKKIVEAKEDLERMKHEAENARRELKDIEKSRDQFITEFREEGLKLYDAMVKDAKQSADRILTDAKLAADNEVRLAAQKLKETIVNEALAETIKLAGRPEGAELKNRMHEKLLERFLSSAASSAEGTS